MPLDLNLSCDECGAVPSRVKVWLRWAPWSVLTIQGGVPPGWYVDGGSVRCPDHRDPEKVAAQDRMSRIEEPG